ncbi:fungal-specific transcription factor domain-containing protein [Stachybotrys elegans]|uniref:Fungal-specific transcription factor domain-containing protein n=1 Tax=Stachybotrys elegans TaxID=80388 RepID=A0A8K0SG40_9HYPO|nr:fungal-specific transcription factor domain-containing protein [Stachybotrys elegans]
MEEDTDAPATKRPKIRLACQVCRDRKIRCDGGRPVCGSCARRKLGVENCVYADGGNDPPSEYIKSLESRIKDLEKTIATGSQAPSESPRPSSTAPVSLPGFQSVPFTGHGQPMSPASAQYQSQPQYLPNPMNRPYGGATPQPPKISPASGPGVPEPPYRYPSASPAVPRQPPVFQMMKSSPSATSGSPGYIASAPPRTKPPNALQDRPWISKTLPSLKQESECGSEELDGVNIMGMEANASPDSGREPGSVYLGQSSAAVFIGQVRSNSLKRRRDDGRGDWLNQVAGSSEIAPSPLSRSSRDRAEKSKRERIALLHEVVLPPRSLADEHLNNYWENFHLFHPILHRPTFQRRYEELWTQELPTVESPYSQPPGYEDIPSIRAFYSLVNAVLAMGCLWTANLRDADRVKHDALASTQRTDPAIFYNRAEKLLSGAHACHGNLLSVQAHITMALYLQLAGDVNRCWLAVGMAIRIAQGIGIHLNHAAESQAQREERRRAWWCCVQNDRFMGMMFGRPPMVVWSVHVPFPADTDDELLSTQPYSSSNPITVVERSVQGYFVHSIAFSDILLNVLRLFYMQPASPKQTKQFPLAEYSQMIELDASLGEWWDQLPDYLRVRHSGDVVGNEIHRRQAVSMRCRYLHLKILLFRPATVDASRGNLLDEPAPGVQGLTDLQRSLAVSCVHSCVLAAQELIQVLHSRCTINKGQLPNAWHSVFCE